MEGVRISSPGWRLALICRIPAESEVGPAPSRAKVAAHSPVQPIPQKSPLRPLDASKRKNGKTLSEGRPP